MALTNYDFLQVGKPGASPWLGGIDVDDYEGDFVKAAAAVPGVTALSPSYGFPQSGKVGDAGFRFYPDQAMVSQAHARGLKVVPWTCDAPATVEALMVMGVDGIVPPTATRASYDARAVAVIRWPDRGRCTGSCR
ncbi:glycerophosphodiester phosphodiesterase family protein [Nonomuraea guangzhouensis]|uniref:Glycerophosphodiester phosphodiesterase family protein n=1 Tax=Nonomuraea guangzhouensis TaxID=1291555 RepID=A0ABW4G452_9ACTN|nr:glycerophosphodiester phosphodiesterase family protein [Nonomuraea guangzhouensis]